MFFFLKKKKLIVDAFVADHSIYEMAPLKLSAHFIPEWWKKFPKEYYSEGKIGVEHQFSTIRNCDGIKELYRNGFVIPWWSDFVLHVKSDGWQYKFANNGDFDFPNILQQSVSEHPRQQYGELFDEYFHIKFFVPWLLSTKEDVKFLMTQPTWNYPQEMFSFHIVPGIIEPKYTKKPNVNCFFNRQEKDYYFKLGEPLAYILPLSEKKIDLRIHLIDDKEYAKIYSSSKRNFNFFGNGKYPKYKKTIKNNQKCPFGF